MNIPSPDLADLGWSAFFQSRVQPGESETLLPLRVMAVHRGRLDVAGDGVASSVPIRWPPTTDPEDMPTVGDWLLAERETLRPRRLLARKSLFRRRAPGTGRRMQLIAANVDTLFIVSSCNRDFNIARLERYLVLAREAGVYPVIVLTKADLAADPGAHAAAARRLEPGLLVETVDARDAGSVRALAAWCGPGQTVALLGSSGVGKSTLVNTLTGAGAIATRPVRGDDDRGRHTTTARALHRLGAGGWLLDTPGMRELQLADAAAGVAGVFADIGDLAARCRFADCTHDAEPGCAVRAAVAAGTLDAVRLARWRKLVAEEARNSESLAARRARERAFGKLVRLVTRDSEKRH